MANSEKKRLFVGNLPPDIQEHEIKTEFSYYGPVNKVELKQKKAADTDEVQSSFAFITITIDEFTLRQCLQEFKSQQFRGRYLQVTVARENFLEKLKREREEAAESKKTSTSQSRSTDSDVVNAVLPTMSTGDSEESDESSSDESSEDECANQNASVAKQNGVKKFGSSSESESDHANDPDNLVLRKKSKVFVENGRIKIDRAVSTGEAIHVIETKSQKTNKKELDEKSKLADQKRLESMKKMKNSYNEQRQAIKKALTGVDAAKKSKKIIFDADDDEYNESRNLTAKKSSESNQQEIKTSSKKPKLFDDGDSDAEPDFQGNFEIKKQFEGEKGEKLRRLQDRFQGDNRFKLDSRFLEDDDSDGDGVNVQANQMHGEQKSNEEKSTENIETNESDERQWQMNILESVMGKRIQGAHKPKETQKKAAPSMLRFDPTRAEHTKFVEPKVKKRKTKVHVEPETKRQKTESENHEEEQPMANDEPPVSMEHFYEVRGDLKKSLGSGGFSLLSMFSRPPDDDDVDAAAADKTVAALEKPYEEKSISKNGVKFLADFDPFKCDSSGDEADDNKSKNSLQKAVTDAKKTDIKYESFFQLSSTDERVSEGLTMFKPPEGAENENTDANEYDDAKRQELKNIVKRKMKKSLQNALPRNVKPNKRFKRFAKNL